MKLPFIFLLTGTVFLTACLKNKDAEPEIIIEPPAPAEVRLDSITQGTLYNLTIGDAAEKVYLDLQTFRAGLSNVPYLGITGSLNNGLEDLKDRIPLYGSLIFDKKPSSPVGGQIYFEGQKITSIYFRNGKKTTTWPQSAPNALKIGDDVTAIYEKLVKIQQDMRYTAFFDYIGMSEKNIDTPYDTMQNKSNLWQFNFSIDEKQVMRLDLLFEEGVLKKIKSRYERYL